MLNPIARSPATVFVKTGWAILRIRVGLKIAKRWIKRLCIGGQPRWMLIVGGNLQAGTGAHHDGIHMRLVLGTLRAQLATKSPIDFAGSRLSTTIRVAS